MTSIVAGVLAIVFPDVTLTAISIIVGVQLVLLGALELVDAFTDVDDIGARVLQLLMAGLVKLYNALVTPEQRNVRLLGSAAMMGLGPAILTWPQLGLKTIAVLVGTGMIVRGLIALRTARAVRVWRTAPAR